MRAGILLGLLVFMTVSGCITDPVPDAMEYLAGELPEQDLSGRIHILSAAVAAGHGLRSWPSTEDPVGEGLTMPEGYGDRLRMLHALGTAGAPKDAWGPLEEAAWDGFDGTQFGSSSSISDDALAVAALLSIGTDPQDGRVQTVLEALRDAQADDGGWRYDGGSPGEPDETAWVLRALDMAGRLDDRVREDAEAFLVARMGDDGAYAYGDSINCQSTGLSLLAWHHVGHDAPASIRSYIVSCQNPDGGFPYIKGGPSQVWATSEIVQGLAAWS